MFSVAFNKKTNTRYHAIQGFVFSNTEDNVMSMAVLDYE